MEDKRVIRAPYNEKKEAHGQWLNISQDGEVIFQGMYINNVDLGYWIESRIFKTYYAR
jgi:hypothetical protein